MLNSHQVQSYNDNQPTKPRRDHTEASFPRFVFGWLMLAHSFGSFCEFFWCNIVTHPVFRLAPKNKKPALGGLCKASGLGLGFFFQQTKTLCFEEDVIKQARKVANSVGIALWQILTNRP